MHVIIQTAWLLRRLPSKGNVPVNIMSFLGQGKALNCAAIIRSYAELSSCLRAEIGLVSGWVSILFYN